jgi:hypothetical protein
MKYCTLAALVLTACGNGKEPIFVIEKDGVAGKDGLNSLVALVSSPIGGFCVAGGTEVLTGLDVNANGLIDAGDSNLQSSTICNGVAGADGQDGEDGQDAAPTAFTPVGLLDPCGDAAGVVDEVLLKLSNGTVLASFSDNANGKNTRFGVLAAGTYQTTDNSGCTFSLDTGGNLYNEHY